MTDREQIRATLLAVRRRWRFRLALEALVPLTATVAGVVAVWLLLWPLAEGRPAVVNGARVLAGLVLAGVAAGLLRRLVRSRPSDPQVALYVEEREPALRQSLVSAVAGADGPGVASGLAARVEAVARKGLASVDDARHLERPRIRRAGGMVGAITLGSVALLAFGPDRFRVATATLVNPWRPVPVAPSFLVGVDPGDAEVPKGGGVDISAVLNGFVSEDADLVFRSDSAGEWQRLPMSHDTAAGRFTTRLFDVVERTEYFVETAGIRSPAFTLSVVDLPAVAGAVATVRFPAYTGIPAETIEPAGDLAVLEGSDVVLRATLTRPAKAAWLVIEGRAPVPMTATTGGFSGTFRVKGDAFWRIDLDAPDGRRITGLQYTVDALDDAGPAVRFTAPGRDTKVSAIEEPAATIEATDDFGVRRLALHVSVNGGAEQVIPLADSSLKALTSVSAVHTFFLEEWSLKPGDLVSYFAEAADGLGQTGRSDIYFLEIRPFDKNYREGEQGGGGGGGGGQSAEGLSERQRQIVVGTFNVLRDSVADQSSFRENVTTLTISEGRLREDVLELSNQMRQRRLVAVDSTFDQIAAALDTARGELQKAEELLGRQKPREALVPAQKALQHLQRAEAAYREVQVQRGQQGGGGGGGGGQREADELADLFELETDKLQNQYESVQRDQGQQAERQLDETVERLRRLANRQQQENERMQRAAEAMRNRQPQGGGGGGGGQSQRQLAEEAEAAARQLERLARERNDPGMEDAARRLREAAEEMRRAASASPQGGAAKGTQALDRLRAATGELERARSESRQQEVRGLQDRARELAERQRQAAEQATEPPSDPGQRAEWQKSLGTRKDGLARDVDRLEADAERLSREAAREQPKAARKLAEAAEGLRTNRVRDKLVFSKNLAQRGSPEYVQSFEQQITENLTKAAEQLGQATGALEQSGESRQVKALERARELVQGLESLNQRARAAQRGQEQRPGGGSPHSGEQGQGQGQGGRQPGQQPGQTPAGDNPNPVDGNFDNDGTRQFGREFRVRRQAAESLRADLRAMGQETGEIDRLLNQFRALDNNRTFGDTRGLDRLENDLIEGLKELEFSLWRAFGDDPKQRPAAGASARVPPQFREQVEEYYRSLARDRPSKP